LDFEHFIWKILLGYAICDCSGVLRFKGSGFRIQRFRVQGSKVQGSKVQRFEGSLLRLSGYAGQAGFSVAASLKCDQSNQK
jgi:hypothetical protein